LAAGLLLATRVAFAAPKMADFDLSRVEQLALRGLVGQVVESPTRPGLCFSVAGKR